MKPGRTSLKALTAVTIAAFLLGSVATYIMLGSPKPSVTETQTATTTTTVTTQLNMTTTTTLRVDRRQLFLNEARRFLESQYIPECGLLRAATQGKEGGRIYIASDNLLAQHALQLLNSTLADKINDTLHKKYRGGNNSLHEAILGKNITWPPKTNITKLVDNCSGFEVWWEFRNGSPMNDWEMYGDLLAYHAILFRNTTSLEKLLNLFDSKGIADKVHENTTLYETYKLALAVLAYRTLQPADHLQTYEAMTEILLKMQRGDGGVVTHYYTQLNYAGDANTETTSLAVIALLANR